MSGHREVCQLLLEKGAAVNTPSKNGLTALHLAAQGDHVEVAKALLQYACNIESKTRVGVN